MANIVNGGSQSTIDQTQRAGERASEGAGVPYVPPSVPAPPPPASGGAPSRPAPAAPIPGGIGAGYPIGSYTSLRGDPVHGAVPAGEYNVLESLMGEWEALVGYSVEPSDAQLLAMANQGVQTLRGFGQYMAKQDSAKTVSQTMPWANYGLTADEYASAANVFGTEYRKVTGQDITTEALAQAFQNPRDPTGGLLSASQYQQQLMNDVAIQKQFGWVQYGMDFSAWTQQKLSLRTAFGRDINDPEAATLLQYNKAATGANLGAVARSARQEQQPAALGVAGSFAR